MPHPPPKLAVLVLADLFTTLLEYAGHSRSLMEKPLLLDNHLWGHSTGFVPGWQALKPPAGCAIDTHVQKGIWAIVAAILLAGLTLYYLPRFEEWRIRVAIQNGRESVEEENHPQAMNLVALQYTDDLGLNYAMVKQLLKDAFLLYNRIQVTADISGIQIKDDVAEARLELIVTAVLKDQPVLLIGSAEGRPIPVTLTFEKHIGRWRLIKTHGIRTPALEGIAP
jgi:hypothetical protein